MIADIKDLQYDSVDEVIEVPIARTNPNNEGMYSFNSWDAVGHEYGHHLEKHLGFTRYSRGNHRSDLDDCLTGEAFETNQDGGEPETETHSMSEIGRNLAWREAWPTFYSISAQKSFRSSYRTKVPTVGDDTYMSYNFPAESAYNLNTLYDSTIAGGDACERSIMCYLYQLWDGTSGGSLSDICSEEELWDDVYVASLLGASTFYEFYEYLSEHHDEERLEELNSIHQMSASTLTPGVARLTRAPIVSWDGAAQKMDGDGAAVEHCHYKVDMEDDDGNHLLSLSNGSWIEATQYQLNDREFRTLSGKQTLVIITKQTYNTKNGITNTYSTFLSKPFSLRFPLYISR